MDEKGNYDVHSNFKESANVFFVYKFRDGVTKDGNNVHFPGIIIWWRNTMSKYLYKPQRF